ncbi:MAG: 16S rRNA (cytosine(1402)-N(4))-methyltransferase RsmH, partial [Proteobacteria bacterium]|nr:16S rRNA (cytosine(1402)-N(4))-methyltransferase RsmH [Pseudomonadota bacterium]
MSGAERFAAGHRPVLLDEVLDVLEPRDGAIYVDGTFGAGGYSRALLAAARCTVWGIDRDPTVIPGARRLERESAGRLTVLAGRFGEMDRLLAAQGVEAVDGVALDLGVSSMQLDIAERGFSFGRDGPLDMRMEQAGESAADVVNGRAERELAAIIFEYGEERWARRIAKAIVAARTERPITRTAELATIVRRMVRRSADGIDPATRTFQALR